MRQRWSSPVNIGAVGQFNPSNNFDRRYEGMIFRNSLVGSLGSIDGGVVSSHPEQWVQTEHHPARALKNYAQAMDTTSSGPGAEEWI
jgi:hypothetical protein